MHLPNGLFSRKLWLLALCGLAFGCGLRVPVALTPRRMGPVNEMIRPQPDLCAVEDLQELIGQHFTALADAPLQGQLRILWPEQEIDADVKPTRLNAEVTGEGRIRRLFCG